MSKIEYVGLNSLEKADSVMLDTIVSRYLDKIDRALPGSKVRFHAKLHDIGGRVKYSFHAKVKAFNDLLRVEATDWDLNRTAHKTMEKLVTAIEHRMHAEGQKQQKFHPKKAKRGFGKQVKLKMRGRVRF